MINVPEGAVPVGPSTVHDPDTDQIACVTSGGYLLVFKLSELPELSKGKGNKLINIPPKLLKAGEEFMVGLAVIPQGGELLIWAGQRYLRMSRKDLEHYTGDRAKRGRKLPRGFQRVTKIELAEEHVA
jgi:topoisomerase-4 subunit A